MDSGHPNASWHPAMMPNTNAEINTLSSTTSIIPDAQAPLSHDATSSALQQEAPVTSTATFDEEPKAPSQPGFDDQFVDEDPEAAGWDLSHAQDAQASHAAPTSTSGIAHEFGEQETEPEMSSTALKHMSTTSFARTVSHEMNFYDDEDAEWNLQRTQTDPFSFMPPNDRTNSFPAVPPADHTSAHTIDHPPAPTQAQEILDEAEHAQGHVAATTSSGFPDDDIDDESSHPQFGGDIVGADAAASDSRFEEGMPLIQREQETAEPAVQAPSKSKDLFGDEEAGDEGDDFFSNVPAASTTESNDFEIPQTLQRKSTSMVIGSALKPTTLSRNDTQDTIDEEDLAGAEEDEVEEHHAGQANGSATAPSEATKQSGSHDLDAKWAEAFGDDDDDFLLEDTANEAKNIDAADFFGSDDEGFLEDTPDVPAAQPQTSAPANLNGRYTPVNVPSQSSVTGNPYAPTGNFTSQPTQPVQSPFSNSTTNAMMGGSPFGAPQPPKPDLPKSQSFVGKAKGGYESPYDLPMDIVKQPKKRASMQQMSRPTSGSSAPAVAPPRSASAALSPPSSSHSNQQQPSGPPKTLKSKPSFFEDLPISAKARPTKQHMPSPHSPYAQPELSPPPAPPMASASAPPAPTHAQPGIPSLVAPEMASPYAPLQGSTLPKATAPPSTRYSPAPTQAPATNIAAAPPSNRYSPAPPASRSQSATYAAVPGAVPAQVLPHLPRTSSPLAHFEVSHERPSSMHADVPHMSRSGSMQYEPRLTRVASLPPTREVDEDESSANAIVAEARYSPSLSRHTPPPQPARMASPSSSLSPPKRTSMSYAPQPNPTPRDVSFAPPPRSQTQSPGSAFGNRAAAPSGEPIRRPSSVQDPVSPKSASINNQPPTITRARGMSQHLSLVAPTDGREHDPLQRWRGAPLIAWGLGGSMVTTFPKDIPRYGISQALPSIIRSPGEVKIKHVKDVQPLEERLAKFPGPLRGKSKKKDTVAWLTAGIDTLEKDLPNDAFNHFISHDDKRAIERVLLWKILRVLIEHDGVLEGKPEVDKAVRDILSPDLQSDDTAPESSITTGAGLTSPIITSNVMRADAVEPTAVEQIRKHLLTGDREKAVWAAADKRLWGHALLIAGTVTGDLYKQVSQEFVKKEVNHPGHNNESLAALYDVLSGNHEESVDELVPVHARAGLQLISTAAVATPSQDALAGLDKWRETLGLILSNRSAQDVRALTSLGSLLSNYGRAEAAHICFIFARQHAVFGGLDDPNANFVLVGADHRRQADQFAKESEALLLSEVYEYGLSLAGGSNAAHGCPHLAAYKLQQAQTLAEYGYRDKALQYCEAILTAISSQTKRSPYYHPVLESFADDLARRLKLAPKEETSSWISKPRMDQVSSSMWTRFNKFVAGDENDGSGNGQGADGSGEAGPFARLATGTPIVSRSPSFTNFDMHGASAASPTLPATKASSRYAPGAPQVAASPADAQYPSYDSSQASVTQPTYESTYGDGANQQPSYGYQPIPAVSHDSPYMPAQNPSIAVPPVNPVSGYQPFGSVDSTNGLNGTAQYGAPVEEPKADSLGQAHTGYQAPSYGYEPPTLNTFDSSVSQLEEPTTNGGYEAPSYQPYSYEPPSYQPDFGSTTNDGNAEAEDEPKPKKKGFMDDDDDDFPSMKSKDKSKAEKDKENEEMFRKAAEEDAKRAAEAKAKKGGWGFGGWFGAAPKKEGLDQQQPKAIKAKLGEESSFVYDPDLKRWVNKKPGAENTPAKTATPPPPRATPGPGPSGPPASSSAPPMAAMNRPPTGPPRSAVSASPTPQEGLSAPSSGPPMMRSVSNMSNMSDGPPMSAPPSRPATSLSNASSIDDLLGPAGPRKAGAKKAKKGGRYVDVMAK